LRRTCSFLSESDDFWFNVDLEMDVGGDSDAEYLMMLPLSFPSRPNVNLETDIANSLEEL
jgi:hypothetical protein